ncbi:MAG: hypothetical protein V4819_01675 [Verrucomicrobiota bacterium]
MELLPVISKMQVMYSMVGHYSHIPDRVSFYNSAGSPAGNTNYVVPHLVYEPFVTLYNPHNTELRMSGSRVRLSDPPVGFKFRKNNDYLRAEWATGDTFHGLARFQISNENNSAARKTLTMVLGGGTAASYAGQIVLQPGESKTFAVRIETNWTWGLETAGGYNPRCFYDWDIGRDFTNKDARTVNNYGAESIPTLGFRAGFQSDHLSLATGRPAATRYPFESSSGYGSGGWVAIKTTDLVRVEAKALRTTAANPAVPDFQLALLRGVNADATADQAKSYSFNAAYLTQPGAPGAGVPALARTFSAGSILQSPADVTEGGKTPFAAFTIVAKSKALQCGAFQATVQPASENLYETRLSETQDFYETTNVGPSDAPVSGMNVTNLQRIGNYLMLDIAAVPGTSGTWKVKGTADLANGFPDDLTASSTVIEGPPKTGVYKVKVDVSGRGERYFVRIEN